MKAFLFILTLLCAVSFAFAGAYYDAKQYTVETRSSVTTYYHGGHNDNTITKTRPVEIRNKATRPYATINYILAAFCGILSLLTLFSTNPNETPSGPETTGPK